MCGGKEYSFYAKLDEVERELTGKFVRIHQRYLVNPQQVEQIGTDHVAVAGKELPKSCAGDADNRVGMGLRIKRLTDYKGVR